MSSPKAKSEITWDSPLEALNRHRTSKNIQKLNNADILNIYHLLWLLPKAVESIPDPSPFENIEEGQLFQGHGKIVSCKFHPNFFRKGKGRALLYNGSAIVQDQMSNARLNLKWFNAYPNQKKSMETMEGEIFFMGKPSRYRDQYQIVAPEMSETPFQEELASQAKYPTVNTVPGPYIARLIQNIPDKLWETLEDQLPNELQKEHDLMTLKTAFRILHGFEEAPEETYKLARKRLVYEEFTIEQKNLKLRRIKKLEVPESKIIVDEKQLAKLEAQFPYQLTDGQLTSNREVLNDLNSPYPMMRLIQGDVGSGKTTVALIASLLVISQGHQAALMCPTESLARQHFESSKELCQQQDIKCSLLLGSTPAKEKKLINEQLEAGEIDFIIGTHALFQKTVHFKSLKLAIIDEQHKFGVDQRIALTEKGIGTNTLIMTATPIPRSLCMTHFGDLDISLIAELPSNRKGIQTRVVEEENFQKFLAFIKARMNQDEQVYIVVPAIEESENMNLMYLEKVLSRFKKFFPANNIEGIHGQLKAEEKDEILKGFYRGDINLLVSTSVVEVGINNPNATVMAIMNPERFGLSSLHQLRGRVGRGDKPGFCFLICDTSTPEASKNKLKVLEKTNSGFIIAEEDLKIRGHGDLFGKQQSGNVSKYRIADIVTDVDVLYAVKKHFDENDVIIDNNSEYLTTANQRVTSTI